MIDQVIYKLNIPTKSFFGRNIWEKSLCEVISSNAEFSGKVLIVSTGRSLKRLGYIDKLTDCLKKFLTVDDVIVSDEISANPKLSEVEEAVLLGKNNHVSFIIGFGGGSALDAAKAVAAGIASDKSVTKMFREGIAPSEVLPIIAIPTTAGTGSEFSKAAILSDEENETKGGLRGDKLFPKIAIVDSMFTETVPFKVTMETGFDVLAHAIESYVSVAATPFTEMLSEYVMREASMSIKNLVDNLEDTDARNKLSFCSMIMGINLGNASTALPHRMQYPIGAHTGTSHGIGLSSLYKSWLKYEAKYSSRKVEKILELLDVKSIEEFFEIMGLNSSLTDLGLDEDSVSTLVDEVTGSIQNDPASKEENVLIKIYTESL